MAAPYRILANLSKKLKAGPSDIEIKTVTYHISTYFYLYAAYTIFNGVSTKPFDLF